MCNSEDQNTSLNESTGGNIDSDHDSSELEHVSPDLNDSTGGNIDSDHDSSELEHVSPDLNESTGGNIDSDHDSPESEHMSPDSSMNFTQYIPQIQVINRYDNKNKKSNEDKGISKRSIETQCNILKRSVSTRDVAVQTNNEKYALYCQKKAALYVGKVSESADNVYLDIEIPNEIKPRKSIRLGLSKKWKLEYKLNN